ncbi:hypothetical protein PSTG_02874 [Puccinia striiformis f. sp. tritici PST-78]|uniref:SH3 domain-containing protein n=1 Tax=Puccinia striiformis f. sp. tritici PST-78 TaxID=1165861 RepID=A0A0L0VWT7_9BASI|nr:hypothetical protein PSTG_02874 [Puccinia striiformis f. sp. tritici PST-78]
MKVNKRIGKLKQWTGEKLGGQQKTELSEDFQSLEQDVELRKLGVEKMYSVSKEYSKHLTKKSEAEGTDTGRVIPIEGLGLVLSNHGDEFGSDSSFGEALVSFGKAHQQMATATSNYTENLNSTWLTSLEKSIAQMSEYTNQRKKLDSRRLTYDAMLAKVQKSKKEKRDLEDDLRLAKNRYEETSEEVQERAIAIQDSEADQMLALTKLLEIQSIWIDDQKRILDDLKRNWVDPSAFKSAGSGRKKTAHTFGAEPAPTVSKTLIKSKGASSVNRRSRSHYSDDERDEEESREEEEAEEEESYEEREPDISLSSSTRRQPRPAVTAPAKPRQTPSRRASLIKEKSNTTPNSTGNTPTRYGGVRIPGMPPVPGTASIQSDESNSPTLDNRHRSNGSIPPKRQSSNSNLRRPPSTVGNTGKWMKAKWAYNATESDELEFEIGDRVRVTNEINGEWFVGKNEATGKTGMFPSAYCVPEDTPSEHPRYLTPDVHDTFADPDEHYPDDQADQQTEEEEEEDESENAILRPHRPAGNLRPPISANGALRTGSYNGRPSSSTSTIGKRAPPPPPSRRSTTTSTSSKPPPPPHPPSSFSQPEQDNQPEAFGSVSELKKRLGMFK